MAKIINNFSGNITRGTVGDMNSGFARISRTAGTNPFTAGGTISFVEQPTLLDPGHSVITDLVVGSDTNVENGTPYIYMVDRSGSVYKVNPATDAITVITRTLGITIKYGGGLVIFNRNGAFGQIMISHDKGMLYMNVDGTNVVNYLNTFQLNFTSANVNVSPANTIVVTGGGEFIYTGQSVTLQAATPPAPLDGTQATTYYVIYVSNSTTAGLTIQLASSLANAQAGIAINLTSTGSGFMDLVGSNWIPNIPHPITKPWFGGIFIGNGYNLFDFNISSLTANPNRLSPSVPKNYIINSLEVDGQGRYLRIGVTTGTSQDVITQDPTTFSGPISSTSLYWNGSDNGYDSYDPFQQTTNGGSYSFLGTDVSLANDFYGAGLYLASGGQTQKLYSSKHIRVPTSNAITSSGMLMLFGAPYYMQVDTSQWITGVFGYGYMDGEQPTPHLYSLAAITPTAPNTISTAVGILTLAQNSFLKSDGTTVSDSKFYVSSYETLATGSSSGTACLYSFNLTPVSLIPTLNASYQTQTEKFASLQQIDNVTVYCTATKAGTSFMIELIDLDNTVPSGGQLIYTYSPGTDDTLLQGSLEKIEFGAPSIKNMQAMGIRIVNLGTVQPNIGQIIIESHDADKLGDER